jgi:hypothetical protein
MPHACQGGWICEAHPSQPYPHDDAGTAPERVDFEACMRGKGLGENWRFSR